MRHCMIATILLVWSAGPCLAQVAVGQTTPSMEAARTLFEAGDWENAAEAYKAIVDAEPSDGQAWLYLGACYQHLQRYGEAAAAYEEAARNGVDSQNLKLAAASVYALMGQKEAAFDWLQRALEGRPPVQVLKGDPDLAGLREDPRFDLILAAAERKAHPCEHDDRYQALDFWLGEWDVFSRERQVGSNRIEKILRGCVVLESWTSGFGTRGRSMNYYDPATGTWRQNWVDEGGGVVRYEGEPREGAMYFEGEHISPEGEVEKARVTLETLPEGRVHHLIEHSRDGGETWFVWFDATYVRREEPEEASTDGP